MNYRLNPKYSVILMSQRHNAPYVDRVLGDGYSIEYEGHDLPKTKDVADPKKFDQPRYTKTRRLTENGRFAEAVDEYKASERRAEVVRVYEKLHDGVWSEKGFFLLVNYVYKKSGLRHVFRFRLEETGEDFEQNRSDQNVLRERTRIFPSEVKREVWIRDGGKCVICGARDELHFDHELPYSKGGASITAKNVRILCARHNLQKSGKIEQCLFFIESFRRRLYLRRCFCQQSTSG
jgi:hypothetical protein